ncbi:MAG: hypothetical protein KBC66_02670 [Kiritimatiellae bacterium]|nr:hypothetical protein [Kiritimatiellia bacterium]HOU22000.1 hypothetical protein [Kiritimatiellia bacterium]HQN01658.1 hypothetical protein [Candidatus Hydrogenedentota bacterium]HQQ60335.1 hypothetical protein [Kiritimatiellia bacterium]
MFAKPLVKIAIAYAWGRRDQPDPGVLRDKRWKALRTFAVKAHEEALRRYERRMRQMKLSSPMYLEDEDALGTVGKRRQRLSGKNGVAITKVYAPVTRRLRAGAGRFIWEDILQRINEADILIFDLTPRKGEETTASNVVLELGAALAVSPSKPVFPVIDNAARFKQLVPSDLCGLIVGVIPDNGSAQDRALYSAIVERIADCVERKLIRGFCRP